MNMLNQLTSNAEALRLFFTEDVYLVKDEVSDVPLVQVDNIVELQEPKVEQIVEQSKAVQPSIITAIPQQVSFEYLGKNQKGILILVHDNKNKVSSPQGTELLRKLVKAIELTNNDFALVNYAAYPGTSFDVLKQYFKCKLILSFGVECQQLSIAAQPANQLNEFQDVKLVFTSNLHDLDGDQTAKKMLWATLQKLKS